MCSLDIQVLSSSDSYKYHEFECTKGYCKVLLSERGISAIWIDQLKGWHYKAGPKINQIGIGNYWHLLKGAKYVAALAYSSVLN